MYTDLVHRDAAPPVGEYLHPKTTSSKSMGRMVPAWTLIACAVIGLVFACAVGITTYTMMSRQMQKGSSTDNQVPEPEPVEFHLGGSAYLIGKYCLDTWATADRFCLKHGSKLATIETAQEWQNLHSHLKVADWPLWLGATNKYTGRWHWVSTGAELNYSNWQEGQPKTSDHNLCMLASIWEDLEWCSSDCGHHSGVAFCEKTVSKS